MWTARFQNYWVFPSFFSRRFLMKKEPRKSINNWLIGYDVGIIFEHGRRAQNNFILFSFVLLHRTQWILHFKNGQVLYSLFMPRAPCLSKPSSLSKLLQKISCYLPLCLASQSWCLRPGFGQWHPFPYLCCHLGQKSPTGFTI